METQNIRFTPQDIPIHAYGQTKLAPGVVGEGTGLGYYQIAEGGYVLVHLQSGTKLGSNTATSQGQAQTWLQLVAHLADWQRSAEEIRADPQHRVVSIEIAQAWAQAMGQI